MTLAMLVILYKANKFLFLMLIISAGFAFWGLKILVSKLLGNYGRG